LANGNTLFVDPQRHVTEVTSDSQVVWQWGHSSRPANPALALTGARRFRPDELTFLKGERHERPR